MLKIAIDDIRTKPDNFNYLFKNPEQFLTWFAESNYPTIQLLSLDYDMDYCLGVHKWNGLDLINQLIDGSEMDNIQQIQFHSDNYPAVKQMIQQLKDHHYSGKINPYMHQLIDGTFTQLPFIIT